MGALVLWIGALARPQTESRTLERQVSGIDIMMVMDVSLSMNAADLGERNRFEIAKDTIRKFIRGRENDRIGFSIFSGEPLTLTPPTLDYTLVLDRVRDTKIGILKDGTAIGDGLAVAVNRLKDSTAKSRVIILLTDGENNVGQIDPKTAGDLAAGFKIRVYTIAIGKEGRVRLPIRQGLLTTYQFFDNQLNTKLLEEIAAQTQGKFFRVTDAQALERVFQEIDHLERSEVQSPEKIRYEDLFHRPVRIGFLLLLLEQAAGLLWWRFLT
jgi:Ca-activated chloride channel family protein